MDDTGCVQECLRDRGHTGLGGPWQEEEEDRSAPSKPRESCSPAGSQIKGVQLVRGVGGPPAGPG